MVSLPIVQTANTTKDMYLIGLTGVIRVEFGNPFPTGYRLFPDRYSTDKSIPASVLIGLLEFPEAVDLRHSQEILINDCVAGDVFTTTGKGASGMVCMYVGETAKKDIHLALVVLPWKNQRQPGESFMFGHGSVKLLGRMSHLSYCPLSEGV